MNFLEFYDTYKLIEGNLLTEDNRKELLAKVDPKFIHHAENTKELPEKSPTGAVYKRMNILKDTGKPELEVWFETRGATYENHPWWAQRIIVVGLLDTLKKNPESNIDRMIRDALDKNDLLIGCTCPAANYYYNFTTTKKGVVHPRFKETLSSPINNPNLKGIMCKHVALCMNVILANTYKMVADVKKIVPELTEKKLNTIKGNKNESNIKQN